MTYLILSWLIALLCLLINSRRCKTWIFSEPEMPAKQLERNGAKIVQMEKLQ